MVEVYETTTMYIACPARVATGGPESLHQLCYNLRNVLEINAYMFYYPAGSKNPVHPEYEYYRLPFTDRIRIEDAPQNIIIVPEVKDAMDLLQEWQYIRKVVWFLSIDNYYLSRLKKTDFLIKRLLNKCYRTFRKGVLFEIDISRYPSILRSIERDKLLKEANLIMANTYRGLEFLREHRYAPVYLSGYLNENFLKTQTDLDKKENVIVYNPRKGFAFTRKIIARAPDLRFVPVANMTRGEVIKLLQRAKVYIDFGNHPGKDRLPREAAILGCCVITGKRGSAAYFEDVPIPESYKFEDREENIPAIIAKIRYCLSNFAQCSRDFDYYREIIRQEPQKFIEDLKRIFVKV